MIVLKATQTQYGELNGYANGAHRLEYVKDCADNWIVGKSVLTDPYMSDIKTQLEQLEEINFCPQIDE